jgi:NADH-quinone oxidoreductase subunit L
MFRSYYMTFTGEYRGGEGHGHHAAQPHGDAHAAHGHDDHGHGHGGGTPHESPRTITWVLATLAIGSVLTLFLGLPALWTHRPPALEHWLEPVLTAQVPFAHKPHALEWVFQGLGILAGAVGWVCARALYKDGRSEVPARLLARWKGAWTVVYNKYYVDELYDAVVVRPSVFFAAFLSWFDGHVIDWAVNFAGWITRLVPNVDGAIDKYLVDGAVNAVAAATIESGRALRRVQTGRIQTYLYGALAGGLAVVLLNFLIR